MRRRRRLLSRRQFLALAGCATGSIAATCAAGSVGLYALVAGVWSGNDDTTGRTASVASVPSTPDLDNILRALPQPRIYSRAEWGARPVNLNAENEHGIYSNTNPEGWLVYDLPLNEAYQTVVIHHSALYENDDLSTLYAVQDLHMDDRGWADIGYHYMVGRDGGIYAGRDVSVRGTHTALHNTGSVGVCLLGDLETNDPTEPQLAASQALVDWLAIRLQLTHLAGHGDFNVDTVCPGAQLTPHLETMAAIAGVAYGTEGYVLPPGITPAETATPEALAALCCCCGAA